MTLLKLKWNISIGTIMYGMAVWEHALKYIKVSNFFGKKSISRPSINLGMQGNSLHREIFVIMVALEHHVRWRLWGVLGSVGVFFGVGLVGCLWVGSLLVIVPHLKGSICPPSNHVFLDLKVVVSIWIFFPLHPLVKRHEAHNKCEIISKSNSYF